MHWLTKYKKKKCHAHSHVHSITWPHYHPYISSSSHSCIEPSLHGLDFFFEIFLWRFVSDKNLLTICYAVPCTHIIAMHHPCICVDKWLPTASTLCPLSLSCKKAQAVSPSYAQSKAQRTISREFCDYWWLFQMLHVSRYGTSYRLVEEERKKGNNSDFRPLISGLRLYYVLLLLLQTGAGSISCSMYF